MKMVVLRIIFVPAIKLIKFATVPFLYLWAIIRWVLIILIAPIILMVELIKSIKRGDWK